MDFVVLILMIGVGILRGRLLLKIAGTLINALELKISCLVCFMIGSVVLIV